MTDAKRNILVAVDFSPTSEAVIDAAIALALATGDRLWLLHVAAPDPEFIGYGEGPEYIRDSRAHEIRDERHRLHEMAEKLQQERGIEVHAQILQGPTAEVIERRARELQARLTVIGSHGHSLIRKTLLGSVSELLLQETRIPVLIIPGQPEART